MAININKDTEILKPSFYDNFKCKANLCRHNCCQEWRIDINKNEYSKIKNALKGTTLAPLKDEIFKRNKDYDETKFNYATMQFDENNKCKFLDENAMCSLQLTCGYPTLPIICKIFPRQIRYNNNTIYRTVSCTCEATNEILMELKDGIDFTMERLILTH